MILKRIITTPGTTGDFAFRFSACVCVCECAFFFLGLLFYNLRRVTNAAAAAIKCFNNISLGSRRRILPLHRASAKTCTA